MELDEATKVLAKEVARTYIDRGEDIPKEVYKIFAFSEHDARMAIKLDDMVRDPVEYFAKARKQARKDVDREMREEFLRPFKIAFNWLLRRRQS